MHATLSLCQHAPECVVCLVVKQYDLRVRLQGLIDYIFYI